MSDDGWEARMAERARQRAATALASQRAIDDQEWREYDRWRRAEAERTVTLGSVRPYPGLMCACATSGPTCCMVRAPVEQRLKAYATYAARLMAAAVHDRSPSEEQR